jgi:hypothetical protein
VIAYRATLDVPAELAQFAARLLLAERHRRGTPRGSRALTLTWRNYGSLVSFFAAVEFDSLAA